MKFKVGDRVRITEDNPNSAPLKKGYITTINETGVPSRTGSGVMGYRVVDSLWWVEEKYLELVKEEPMEYRLIKTVNAMTILEKGPCATEYIEYIKTFGFREPDFDDLISWARQRGNLKWLIDKGFIERVEQFKPVTITLESQDVVDSLFAIMDHNPVTSLFPVNNFDKQRNQLRSFVKNSMPFFFKLSEAWNKRA